MKIILIILTLTIYFIFPLKSSAQNDLLDEQVKTDTLAMHLQDAILLTLENNPTVTIQRISPDIMKTYAREQRAAFDPELSVSASKSETKMQRFLGSRPDPFELTSERLQYDIAINEV